MFDHLYYRGNQEYQWENSDRKRYALNWLHYAGFVDYDYKTGKVTALPPAFIALPAEHGPNRFLLVGSRSCRMLEEISRFCGEHRKRVRMEINRQDESLKNLLLPDVVIIEVTGMKRRLWSELYQGISWADRCKPICRNAITGKISCFCS